jgi:ribosome-associated protein
MTSIAESNRIESSRRLAVDAARIAGTTHCTNVVILDVRGLSPITDFLVIATGTSPRQMRSVAEEVMEMAEQRGDRALSTNGLDGGTWIVADFIDIVLHIFSPEARMYYDLDNLWGDARRVEWQDQPTASPFSALP